MRLDDVSRQARWSRSWIRAICLVIFCGVLAGPAASYDPKAASEATGKTIRQLDEHGKQMVNRAAQLTTLMRWCNMSGFDVPGKSVGKLEVHKFDFKNHVERLRSVTLDTARKNFSWKKFCGEEIFAIYGPKGDLFRKGGPYEDWDAWIKPLTVKKGMSKRKLEAEVLLTAAYYGASRCNLEFDTEKEEAFKAKHGLDADWYSSFDQNNELLNEVFLRLGPESLMNCRKFSKKYRHLLKR